jgi:hypothetical protein
VVQGDDRGALANLVPLLFWDRIESWARGALVLYAGR